jgi:hypothetical protein
MILIAGVLFLCSEVLLYYRWATIREPTCVLIIETGTQLKGALIEVDGDLLGQPHKLIVGEGDRYLFPVYIEPGRYTIKLTQNDQVLLEQPVDFTDGARGKKFDLTKLRGAASQPSVPPPSPSPPPLLP